MPRSVSPEERIASLEDGHRSSTSSTTLGDYAREDLETFSKQSSHPWAAKLLGWCTSRPRNLRRIFRRHPGHPILTIVKNALLFICALFIGTPIFAPSYTRPPPHYRELIVRCDGAAAEPGCANPFKEKVYISVSLYDKGGHLASGTWGKALEEVIHLIGENNVFLSIYENDSGPEGASALAALEEKLRCKHKIVSEPHVPVSDFPTVRMPDGSDRVKRLSYLSEMRNRALRPIDTYDPDVGTFDKILFLNDVAFRPVDAMQLLFSTNLGLDGKTHYLSVCGLDYNNPFLFYDLYAQRDAEGFSNGLPIFPIFSNAGHGISRAAMMAQSDAVPVTACWGGIVAMQAKYVQNMNQSLPDPDFQSIGSHVIDPASPRNVTSPVRFRYEPEIFFDACECCLFLADVAQVARKEDAKEVGTYVNPYVRVAYDESVLGWIPWVQRWERLFSVPQAILTYVLNLPTHNPHRTVEEQDGFMEEVWVGKGDKGHWELVQREARNGLLCGVREMQLISEGVRGGDVNWENTVMPPGQTLHFPT
ncbi:cryptococcal mannosyltransferase 1-domain-containing protein [Pseudomassariella vexata]|uniref:Cryptococcal mannosyltransferase 1-domain-containing protein n=1 Tax=Pseudomassariella vexata TaxID=1141098 RepID=A0A1Y2DXC6_9PEZI|nr:cryptococcal mannosyltransferase 1-domain-containing protein [Pseudomassariella vexata]ORY63897.1 cryptococcal mannosyltransferase 1-domain-containing protein [Pseudomassariella vexata]